MECRLVNYVRDGKRTERRGKDETNGDRNAVAANGTLNENLQRRNCWYNERIRVDLDISVCGRISTNRDDASIDGSLDQKCKTMQITWFDKSVFCAFKYVQQWHIYFV